MNKCIKINDNEKLCMPKVHRFEEWKRGIAVLADNKVNHVILEMPGHVCPYLNNQIECPYFYTYNKRQK